MWLINSSIGRKVVMSVTGIALILFLTFQRIPGCQLVCCSSNTRFGCLGSDSHCLRVHSDSAEPYGSW